MLYAARPITWLVASLVGACFAAAALIPIDKVVSAQGRIVAVDSTSVVQPLETAIVRSIDVREGDRVSKGQILARLDPTFATADVGALRAQVASLQAEVDRLSAEAGNVEYRPTGTNPVEALQGALFLQHTAERSFKNENYAQKINGLRNQIQRALSDVYGYAARLKVASEVEQKRVDLEKLKVGSVLNRLQATDSRLEVKRGLDNAAAQAEQAQRDLQALQAERDAYNQNWRGQVGQELTESSRKLSDATENLKKAELRRQLVELRATEDATVLTVAKVSPGSVMQSGEQLITLVPTGAALEAEINVAGADAGYIHPGDPDQPQARHAALHDVRHGRGRGSRRQRRQLLDRARGSAAEARLATGAAAAARVELLPDPRDAGRDAPARHPELVQIESGHAAGRRREGRAAHAGRLPVLPRVAGLRRRDARAVTPMTGRSLACCGRRCPAGQRRG